MRLPTQFFLVVAGAAVGALATDYSIDAGFHVIYSYEGTTIPDSILDAASAGTLGGVILFGANVYSGTAAQIDTLQAAYRTSPNYPGYPLLIVTDQEGGEVNRLPGGPTQSAKDQGSSSDPASAAGSAGTTTASVFSTYHVNGDLAPVLGVYRSAGDFLDQYERSYSDDASTVAECVGPFITNLQSAGYVATAKHFPGLGAATASEDTDAEPVTINLSLDTLRSVDEVPYATAISSGVKMVMPSWAVYPAMDNSPSGLSSNWIQNELRGRLGFTGVTISDAIEAGALGAYGESGNRAVLAMTAGMDIILAAAGNTTQGLDCVAAIADAVDNGDLDATAFSESTKRIQDLRSAL